MSLLPLLKTIPKRVGERRISSAARIQLALFLSFALSSTGYYVNIRLSGTVPPSGNILHDPLDLYTMSPDGQYVVFVADYEVDGQFELYSVSLQGSRLPIRLNLPLPAGRSVNGFAISPDSQRVVYLVQFTTCCLELYSVPIAGGASVKLSDPISGLPPSGVADYQIAPDSSRVVFRFRASEDSNSGLYSASLTNGTKIQLNDPSIDSDVMLGFAITPDSAHAIYSQPQSNNGQPLLPLLRVPLAGGAILPFGDNDQSWGGQMAFSPDGARVVYLAATVLTPTLQVYSMPVAGGQPIRLNAALAPQGNVGSFQISPDGQYVVYEADQDTDEVFELYSAPIIGGTAEKLSGVAVAGGDITDYTINSTSSHVVFRAGPFLAQDYYSVPIIGGWPVQLNTGPETHGLVLTPDGTQVVFQQNQVSPSLFEIFRVPIEGGSVTPMTTPFADGGGALGLQVTPDSQWLIYRAKLDGGSGFALYAVPMAGGPASRVSPALPPDRDVGWYWFNRGTSLGQCTVYVADLTFDNAFELGLACPATSVLRIPLVMRP